MRRTLILGAALTAAVTLGIGISDAAANGPNLSGRGNFGYATAILPTNVCWQFPQSLPDPDPLIAPAVPTVYSMGVDDTGPFFTFWAVEPNLYPGQPVKYTYRPRGTIGHTAGNPGHFGDGMIGAVKCFQEFFERWQRGSTSLTHQTRPATLRDQRVLNGACFSIPQSSQTHSQHVITVNEWALGQSLEMYVDPSGPALTLCFEDYKFNWNPN